MVKDKDNKLFLSLKNSPPIGTVEIQIPAGKNRAARTANQTIHAKQIELKAPYRQGEKLENITINAVLAIETNPPKGTKALQWVMLTNLPISTPELSFKVIEYYLCRWQIEVFFKILKSGCKVEEAQFMTLKRLLVHLAGSLIIAYRIAFFTMSGRINPEIDCDAFFEDDEWKASLCLQEDASRKTSFFK